MVTTGTGSGKTECFLLPVLQNALEDATRFRRPGLTAILVYPLNALAADQLERIEEFLEQSGFADTIDVGKYDRSTKQAEREEMRRKPPHILLTNYMMLEYLLVRPADRDGLFANHRCRFLVLDEVHTYRGTLGSNIALLVRRLRTHLDRARQDWDTDPSGEDRRRRFPTLIPVGASATIKSIGEDALPPEQLRAARDEAVREFFSRVTGAPRDETVVLGEELEQVVTPDDAGYAPVPPPQGAPTITDPEAVRTTLCRLAGLAADTPLPEAARRCRLLWDLNRWLTRLPLSVTQLVARVQAEVSGRGQWRPEEVRREVVAALYAGAALPDGTPGALRLRAHRFIRGGWQFHRCVDPACGRLYPMGEDWCTCGQPTAPLYMCRNCGADYLRFVGDATQPSVLAPNARRDEGPEWLLYDPDRLETFGLDEDLDEAQADAARARAQRRQPAQMAWRPVLHGSFDHTTLTFSSSANDYPQHVTLVPAAVRSASCGRTAGSRAVITPVMLGTSAAVKVLGEGLVEALAEQNTGDGRHDGKERLLIFSDSRQDAAHQARFIIFASRYDRMRRRVFRLLQDGPLGIQRVVERLGELGLRYHDNPHRAGRRGLPLARGRGPPSRLGGGASAR